MGPRPHRTSDRRAAANHDLPPLEATGPGLSREIAASAVTGIVSLAVYGATLPPAVLGWNDGRVRRPADWATREPPLPRRNLWP
jgi:hypothetical protein